MFNRVLPYRHCRRPGGGSNGHDAYGPRRPIRKNPTTLYRTFNRKTNKRRNGFDPSIIVRGVVRISTGFRNGGRVTNKNPKTVMVRRGQVRHDIERT